ncbi:MAG: hypothetical protein Q7V15_14130 [Phenylobacterium sp.]|uniref:hypothetical protein n=1 Tax=Phenylobacterium sp. TaxID=1871053 RepID=UPI002718787A|nr:hypothetical protein [Phenylobacterium sp.]MDO8902481.1 hypothetical protein [Phenylobacterium sp.]
MSSGRATHRAPHRRRDPLTGAVLCMLEAQAADGAIPWFEAGPWDPWNHGECVMALAVAGEWDAAWAGLDCLAARQGPDGGWLGEYGNMLPMADRLHMARVRPPAFRDTNFAAYCAVVVWHSFMITGDLAAVRPYWPMVRRAMDFVLALQHEAGDISWSAEAHMTSADDAVRAGCGSIYKSLQCAIKLAELMGEPQPQWVAGRERLGRALLSAPERFDRTADRSGFAMDWYYPMLGGALAGAEALSRLDADWPRFIEPGVGCRCVADQPWVTVAESCELVMTLIALDRRTQAAKLLTWQDSHRDGDGIYWMGWQFEEAIIWPEERPTWTQAAAILAHDALYDLTPASQVLVRHD